MSKPDKYDVAMGILRVLAYVAVFVGIVLLVASCSTPEVEELDHEYQWLTLPDGFECRAHLTKVSSPYGSDYYIARCQDGTWVLNLINARVRND